MSVDILVNVLPALNVKPSVACSCGLTTGSGAGIGVGCGAAGCGVGVGSGVGVGVAGTMPVPPRATRCVPVVVLARKLIAADRAPPAAGVNDTLTWQDAPTATVAPLQASAVTAKSPGFAPASLRPRTRSGALPAFVSGHRRCEV